MPVSSLRDMGSLRDGQMADRADRNTDRQAGEQEETCKNREKLRGQQIETPLLRCCQQVRVITSVCDSSKAARLTAGESQLLKGNFVAKVFVQVEDLEWQARGSRTDTYTN